MRHLVQQEVALATGTNTVVATGTTGTTTATDTVTWTRS